MFESMVINRLLAASASSVSRNMNLSWDIISGIRKSVVERGFARREVTELKDPCMDETSYRHSHHYLTIITDQNTGVVHEVKKDRKKVRPSTFLEILTIEVRSAIESVWIDMFPVNIGAVRDWIPEADTKICFD